MQATSKYILTAVFCFGLSTFLTWAFIGQATIYDSKDQALLSCSIAGAKWALQIILALVFLKENRWFFIRNISITCLFGSAILLPFIFAPDDVLQTNKYFVWCLAAAVIAMIFSYHRQVRKSGAGLKWFWIWIASLAVAVLLQLTVIFQVL